MERLTIPDKKIDGGVRRAFIDTKAVKENAMTIYWALKKYEDTGLTPEQIMELKERDTAKSPKKKLRHRGGFETFHCHNCDTSYQMDRRYTITDEYCPKCGKLLDSSFRSFCANCGQRLEERR